jgi:hypothetical protein
MMGQEADTQPGRVGIGELSSRIMRALTEAIFQRLKIEGGNLKAAMPSEASAKDGHFRPICPLWPFGLIRRPLG